MKEIRHARKLNSTCLDGSAAVFYLSRNSESRNWVIRLQAGGSCVTQQECLLRKETPFGSSKYSHKAITGTFVTSDDPRENPTFHNWNKVFIPYCSGDLFVGRKRAENHIYSLNMLGHYIVTSVFKQLIKDYNISSAHTEIIFGGASAGGIGMLGNIDHIAELVKPAKVLGYNDGGWFTLYPNYKEPVGPRSPEFLNTLRMMFNYFWDGFVDESCRAQMLQPAACLYGEMVMPYLSTPIYVMVSQWDSYQLRELSLGKYRSIHLPPTSFTEARYLAKFGNNTHRSLQRLIVSERSGVFSPACVSHTFAGVNESEAIITMEYQIAGVTPYKALSQWYNSKGKEGTYAEVPLKSPRCNPTCCSKFCAVCRKPDENIEILGPRNKREHTHPSDWATRNSLATALCLLPLLSAVLHQG